MTDAHLKLLDPATANEVIAARIRHFRQFRGLSVRELAVRCADLAPSTSLTAGALTNIERGSESASAAKRGRRTIDVAELIVLATVLEVSIMDLIVEKPSSCPNCHGAPPAGFSCQSCGLSAAPL